MNIAKIKKFAKHIFLSQNASHSAYIETIRIIKAKFELSLKETKNIIDAIPEIKHARKAKKLHIEVLGQ